MKSVMQKLRLVPVEEALGMAGDDSWAGTHKQVKAGFVSVADIYRPPGAVAAEQLKQKPVAYLKKNEAMGLMKVDMYPYFDAWMAPSSSWTVSPLYLMNHAEDEIARLREQRDELLAVLKMNDAEDEIARLREQRDELLAVLKDCSCLLDRCVPGFDAANAVGKALAAIAKIDAGKSRR